MIKTFFTVGIGASAGGIPALIEFFDHLPSGLESAFIVATHLMRDRPSKLNQIISRHTTLPVIRLEKDAKLEIGKIYVIIENTTVTVRDGCLKVQKRDERIFNSCVDTLFESLATDFKEKAIGIILSGGGNDGLSGAKMIKENGGKVLVQSPNSAECTGMPLSIIGGDHPIAIERPGEIARHLDHLCKVYSNNVKPNNQLESGLQG
ncbi:two-component system CheB/CheR fusion protein [Pedobacter cryoconitis]|uniref:protein-glutamate methylesterase n=1 Tax=Pedobacter cryoconitis TaxID=188932 RepID=A0A7W8YYS0_9SPHI|nr:chemotaxis protein CheB [Pedobacter cryoconitis]MBB5624137.1 two-component system CheB/CheR fusion protein [Pedobacter cryoconitis]